MNCIGLYITKSIRSVITDKYTGKCRYMYINVFFISLDVNECNSTSTNTCDSLTQECENTEGSFLCNCKNGYRKVGQACEGKL